MQGEQITTMQLLGLKTHRNANYAARKLEAQSYGSKQRQVDRNPSASTMNHPP